MNGPDPNDAQAPKKKRTRRTNAQILAESQLAPHIRVKGSFGDGKPFSFDAYGLTRQGEFWVFSMPATRPGFTVSRQLRVADVRDIEVEQPWVPPHPQAPPWQPTPTPYGGASGGTYTFVANGDATGFSGPRAPQIVGARQAPLRVKATATGPVSETSEGEGVSGGFLS